MKHSVFLWWDRGGDSISLSLFYPHFLPQYFSDDKLDYNLKVTFNTHSSCVYKYILFINNFLLIDAFSTTWNRNVVPGQDIFYPFDPFQGFIPLCTLTIQTCIIPCCSCLSLFLPSPELLPKTGGNGTTLIEFCTSSHTFSFHVPSHHIKIVLQQYSAGSNTPQSLLWFQKLPCPYFSSLNLIHLMTELPIIWLSIQKSKPAHNISQRKNATSVTEITATNLSSLSLRQHRGKINEKAIDSGVDFALRRK